MRFFKNIFLVLIILGFFITSILGFLVYQAHKHNGEFGTKIVIIEQGTSLSGIANLFKKEELILMTCDPPGTTWNRLLIVARPVPK